jgi:hypothetical protein
MPNYQQAKYPRLEALCANKRVPIQTIYSISQTAELLDMRPRTIRHLIRNGKLAARRLGMLTIFPADLERLLEESVIRESSGTVGQPASLMPPPEDNTGGVIAKRKRMNNP